MENKKPKQEHLSLRDQAEELINEKSKSDNQYSYSEAIRLIHELEVHQIELQLQNEELILANKNAKQSFEKYVQLYDYAPVGYLTLSEEGEIIGLNLQMASLLGKERSYLVNKLLGFFISDKSKPILNTFLKNIFHSNTNQYCELVIYSDAQFPKYLSLNGVLAKDKKQCSVSIFDITESKTAAASIEKGDLMLKKSQTIAKIGTYLFDFSSGKWLGSEVLDTIFGITIDFDKSIAGWISIIHPDWQEIMKTYLTEEVIGKKLIFDKKYKIIRQNDKEERWVHGRGELLFDENNQITKMIGTVQDITMSLLVDEKLNQLSQVVEQSPLAIIITNIKGVIEYANPKFIEMTGYNLEETIGRNPRMSKSGYTSLTQYKNMWQTITSGNVWHGDFRNLKKDGTPYWVSAAISPIQNPEGITTHFLAIEEDITLRKKSEQDLIEAKEHAEESDRLKSAFLANMSHEIRTPLNGIIGFTNLLKEPTLSLKERQEYLEIIEKSGSRLLNIINDIIDISKIESGQMEVSLTETNINKQLEFIYAFFEPEIKNKQIEFVLQNNLAQNDPIIITDSEKIYAILFNLVKNAIKFTNKGKIEFGYTIRKDKQLAELEFFVKDTGIGIPKNKIETIFQRFIQADVSDKRAYEGSGLGLSISKAYVDMLGGKISVDSTLNKGSIFYFTIPYHTVQQIKCVETTDIVEMDDHQITNLKIVIVEDDQISKLLLSKVISPYAKEIVTVSTGYEAITICRANPDIDLILMDINMSGMDGYETTRQIRKFNKRVIIIAQTANVLISARKKALLAGCNDYISKPINKALLSELINKYFKKMQLDL